MDAVVAALMTILTERDTKVLETLFDVVGIRGFRYAANAAGQRFNASKVIPLCCGQFIIHETTQQILLIFYTN